MTPEQARKIVKAAPVGSPYYEMARKVLEKAKA